MAGLTTGSNFRMSTGQKREKLREHYLVNIPPGNVFQSLAVSTLDFSTEYQLQDTEPLDGSNKRLRAYSPFTIETLPPMVFGTDNSLTQNKNSKFKVEVFEAALNSQNFVQRQGNKISLRTVENQSFTNPTSRKALEEFVASGMQHVKAYTDKSGYAKTETQAQTAFADYRVAADIALQVSASIQAPPLTLLINPTSLQIQYGKILQYTELGRFGYLLQTWGEEQPKLSISGMIGGFFTGNLTQDPLKAGVSKRIDTGRSATGLQFASKKNSASWQNLMNIFTLYMNNGIIFDKVSGSLANHLVGALAIRYDQNVYIGHMTNFTFGYEDAKMNGGTQFDFEFTVIAMYDLDAPSPQISPLRSPTASPSNPIYSSLPKPGDALSDNQQNIVSFAAGNENALPKQIGDTSLGQNNSRVGTSTLQSIAVNNKGFRQTVAPTQTSPPLVIQKTPQPFFGVGKDSF